MNEKRLVNIALFAAIIAALGIIPKFDLPFGIPITAQSLGIMLCGIILGARDGALSVMLFLLLVALGLPLLSGGRGGMAVFMGPTGGFLFGYVFAAFACGFVMRKLKGRQVFMSGVTAAIIGGIVILYLFGVPWMAKAIDKTIPESMTLMIAFIPGDLIKAVIAGIIADALYKARPTYLASWKV